MDSGQGNCACKSLADAVNLEDLAALAKTTLDRADHDYFEGGAEDEVALRRNRAALVQPSYGPVYCAMLRT